jgi:hypothetical protein
LTIKTNKGRVILSNMDELHYKRGVNPKMIYNIDDHRYVGKDGRMHYKPYVK